MSQQSNSVVKFLRRHPKVEFAFDITVTMAWGAMMAVIVRTIFFGQYWFGV